MTKTNMGINICTEVLQYALIIENLTSMFLSAILGIKDIKNSKVLGNKSNPISFNQKVQLLIEIEALDEAEKTKFITFMEVRNQFMHNISAINYEACFSYLDGKDKYLLKIYPQADSLTREEALKLAFGALADELVNLVMALYDKLKDKIKLNAESELNKTFKTNALSAISEIEKRFNSIYETALRKGETTFNIEKIKGLGTIISKYFYKGIIGKMGSYSKKKADEE